MFAFWLTHEDHARYDGYGMEFGGPGSVKQKERNEMKEDGGVYTRNLSGGCTIYDRFAR